MFTKSIVNYEKIIGYDFHIETENEELLLVQAHCLFCVLSYVLYYMVHFLYSKIPRHYHSHTITHIYTHCLIHKHRISRYKKFFLEGFIYISSQHTSSNCIKKLFAILNIENYNAKLLKFLSISIGYYINPKMHFITNLKFKTSKTLFIQFKVFGKIQKAVR